MKDRLIFEKTKDVSDTDFDLCGDCALSIGEYCIKNKNGLLFCCDFNYNYKLIEEDPKEIQSEYEWVKQRVEYLKKHKRIGTPIEAEAIRHIDWLDKNKPENWQQCTKDNTKVGDVVRRVKGNERMRRVDFIFDNGTGCVVTTIDKGEQYYDNFDGYEIDINRGE